VGAIKDETRYVGFWEEWFGLDAFTLTRLEMSLLGTEQNGADIVLELIKRLARTGSSMQGLKMEAVRDSDSTLRETRTFGPWLLDLKYCTLLHFQPTHRIVGFALSCDLIDAATETINFY
jgi:hypothetical protein